MAVSKKVEEKLEVVNGLDLIWESRAVYAEILYCFRECHNVCVGSGLFTKEIILQVDQCAVDFRRMSLDTTTVAKRVSNQWLDVAITFFENIDDIDDPKEMLQLLADQARDLARCFKLIAAWARDLGGRFHKAQDGTVKEADEFKAVFQASQESAENAKAQAEKALKSATKRREEAQDTEEAWMISAISLSWCPVANIVTGIGASVAGSSVTKARELEEKAAKELREAKVKLEKMTSDNERAKV